MIDKETKASINIVIDDKPAYLQELRKQAEEDGLNDLEPPEAKSHLVITTDSQGWSTEEYYFEDNNSSLMITGEVQSANGKTFVSINIPLSDGVLIDILAHSIKRLNKLKNVMESLK